MGNKIVNAINPVNHVKHVKQAVDTVVDNPITNAMPYNPMENVKTGIDATKAITGDKDALNRLNPVNKVENNINETINGGKALTNVKNINKGDIGIISIDNNGVKFKPQFKCTVAGDNFEIGGGLDDVRDGIHFGFNASIFRIIQSQGKSYKEVINNLKFRANNDLTSAFCKGQNELLDFVKDGNKLIDSMLKKLHINIASDGTHFKINAKVSASKSAKINGGVKCGWRDTNGYNMIGAGGKVIKGGHLYYGIHKNRDKIKIQIGFPCVDLTMIISIIKQINITISNKVKQESAEGQKVRLSKAPSNGFYIIYGKQSGKVLDITNWSKKDRAGLIQYDVHKGNNQIFYLEYHPCYNKYTIRNKHSSLFLDVSGASNDNGAELIQSLYHKGANQMFEVIRLDDNTYRINTYCGKVLDVAGSSKKNDAKIIQWKWHGGDNQRFRLEKCLQPVVFEGWYHIYSVHSNKVLDVLNWSKDSSAKLIQYEHHGGDNQTFYIKSEGNKNYSIKCKHSGLFWDIAGASKKNGAELMQFKFHGGSNQLFRFIECGNNQFGILATHSNKCIDVVNWSKDNLAKVIQYEWHGGANQRFIFQKAEK